jgi:heptosyltransferase-2
MGYSTDARGFLLTHKVEATEEEFLIHRLEHDLKLLEGFGIGAPRKELVLNLGVEQKGRAKEIFRELGINPGDRVFAMSPGSVHLDHKRWLPDRFASLAGRMVKGFNARGILLGTPNEREICEGIIRQASVSGLDNLAGRTSLEEAIALAALCGLFVTNDSGLMHVAAALDIPLVAIFGPTDPRKTAPWSRRSKVVRNEEVDCFCRKSEKCTRDQVCMTGISVDQVFREAEKMAAEVGFDPVAVREERVPVSSRTVPLVESA